MGWIFDSIANIFLEILNDLLVWTINLARGFQIDIGYDVTNKNVGSLFVPAYFEKGSEMTGLFDKTFPLASYFFEIFMTLAYVLIIILLINNLFKAFLGPLSDAPHPLTSIGHAAISAFFVTWSYDFFILAERFVNKIYLEFDKIYEVVLVDNKLVNKDMGQLKDSVFDFALFDGDQMFKDDTGVNKMVLFFITIIFLTALITSFIKLLIEVYMRYVVLGGLFYTCPLAVACSASDSTREVYTSWIRMVVSQFLLMFLNLFFIAVFTGSITTLFLNMQKQQYAFENPQEFVKMVLLFVSWLVLGQRVDEHLKGMGLSTATTGASLAGAITAGGAALGTAWMMASPLRRAASNGVKRGGSKLGEKIGGTETFQKISNSVTGKASDQIKNAERVNGKLTPDGAKDIFNAAGATVKGPQAKEAVDALGLDPSAQLDANNIDWSNSSVGNGKVSLKDKDGNSLGEYADPKRYEAFSDEAVKTINTGAGTLAYAPGRESITKDSNKLVETLSNSDNKSFGANSDIAWVRNPADNTLRGVDRRTNEVKYVASHDYLAKHNVTSETNNNFVTGDNNGLSYTVQEIKPGTVDSAFSSIRRPSEDGRFYNKTAREKSHIKTNTSTSYDTFRKKKK